MSQHILKTSLDGQPVQVQMGWDSPMKWYYLVVSPVDADGELNDPIYSNLYETDAKSKDLQYYLGVCANLGIAIPDEMIAGVEDDRKTGAMNRVVEYGEDKAS